MVHSPGCDFNDDNMAVGSALWVRLAERFLTVSEPSPTHGPLSAAALHKAKRVSPL